jgi:hypothetical protein
MRKLQEENWTRNGKNFKYKTGPENEKTSRRKLDQKWRKFQVENWTRNGEIFK